MKKDFAKTGKKCVTASLLAAALSTACMGGSVIAAEAPENTAASTGAEVPVATAPVIATPTPMEVPVSSVTEEINGQHVVTEVYEIETEMDPSSLIKEDFIRGDMIYTFDKITKEEDTTIKTKDVTQEVEVKSKTRDLSKNISLFETSVVYEDEEGYKGILYFNPKSVDTEAAGYRTAYDTVAETKTYEGLEYNDPTLIPQSVEKNGYNLGVADIQWEEESTVQDGSVPATYRAVVSYNKTLSSSVATGYVVTAEYQGTVEMDNESDCRYTVTYLGTPIPVVEPEPEPEPVPEEPTVVEKFVKIGLPIILVIGVIGGILIFVAYKTGRLKRRNPHDEILPDRPLSDKSQDTQNK